jgi:ubiquinone/menaquinone biosynthesis C-methylase UbiE
MSAHPVETATDSERWYKDYGGTAPENYERHFVPIVAAPLADDLVARAALTPGERVIDLACGTGVVARLAATRVGRGGAVTGVDVNPGMLEVARVSAPVDATFDWREASADALPFPDGSFDVAFCQLGLQFFADRVAALRELRRVLAPGGRALVSVPGPMPTPFHMMEAALARRVDGDASAFVQAVFSLHEPAEVAGLLQQAGFARVSAGSEEWTLHPPAPIDFLRQYIHSTPLAATLASLDDDARAELEQDIVAAWQPFADGDGMRLEVGLTVATGRA